MYGAGACNTAAASFDRSVAQFSRLVAKVGCRPVLVLYSLDEPVNSCSGCVVMTVCRKHCLDCYYLQSLYVSAV